MQRTETHQEALSHKERLLREGMKEFFAHGYHGTTVDAVLEGAGVPKGSFYHHFGSKEAFGKAVLARYMRFQMELLDRWAAEPGRSTSEKLAGYYGELARNVVASGFQRACLTGKFSTEVSATLEGFREALAVDLREWLTRLRDVLATGQHSGDVRRDRSADELAAALLALIQGGFAIALAMRDEASLNAVSATIPMLIEPPNS